MSKSGRIIDTPPKEDPIKVEFLVNVSDASECKGGMIRIAKSWDDKEHKLSVWFTTEQDRLLHGTLTTKEMEQLAVSILRVLKREHLGNLLKQKDTVDRQISELNRLK